MLGFCIIPRSVLSYSCHMATLMVVLTVKVQKCKDPLRSKQPAHVNKINSYFFPLLFTLSPWKHLHKAIPVYVLKKSRPTFHIHTCRCTRSCSSADALPLPYCPKSHPPQTNTKCFKMDVSVQADPFLSGQALSKSFSRHDGLDQIRHSPRVHLIVH